MTKTPAFPIDVLPPPIRQLVQEASASMGCPPDLIAVPLLGFAAGIIGRNRRLRITKIWEEIAVLTLAVVAPPGSGKSPALRVAQKATITIQNELNARHIEAQIKYRADTARWATTQDHDQGDKLAEPILEQLFTTNATMEAIAVLLQTSHGLVLLQDELVSWIKGMDAYRQGGDRQLWLSLWSSGVIMINRKTSPTIYIEEPAVSIVGGVQPDMLPMLAQESGATDGFIERILWSFPDPVRVQWSDHEVQDQTHIDVQNVFRHLRTRRSDVAGTVVSLCGEARELWIDWFNFTMASAFDNSGLEAGILSKMPIQVARLALVLHCLGDPYAQANELSVEKLAGAIELGDYFQGHARLILPAFGARPMPTVGERIHSALREADDWTSLTEFHLKLGNRVEASDIRIALDELVQSDLAEVRQVATSGRPATQWRLRPRQVESFGDTKPSTSGQTDLAPSDLGQDEKHHQLIPEDDRGDPPTLAVREVA